MFSIENKNMGLVSVPAEYLQTLKKVKQILIVNVFTNIYCLEKELLPILEKAEMWC